MKLIKGNFMSKEVHRISINTGSNVNGILSEQNQPKIPGDLYGNLQMKAQLCGCWQAGIGLGTSVDTDRII